MNDRVRIYELARQMNLSNQDLIVALRELGYDVKSHSSTIDSHVVGLLIAALGKKKQKDKDKDKEKTKITTATTAKAPKAPVKEEPAPPIVKPRVLSRRKPQTVIDAETKDAHIEHVLTIPISPASPDRPAVDTPAAIKPQVNELPEVAASITKAPEIIEPAKIDPLQTEKPEVVEPLEAPQESAIPEQETESKEPPHEDGINPEQINKHFPPPAPVRVAAPSIRATPPRPPKSHRHQLHEKNIQPRKEEKRPAAAVVEVPKVITLTRPLSVQELSEIMYVSETELIKRLFMKGFMRTVNQIVELELAKELAIEMEYEVLSEELVVQEESTVIKEDLSEADKQALVTRPPVVTIMGHVDHGKTSLLDAIRQTKFLLTDAEAGGITQHTGAYHVEVPGEDGQLRQIVFLDTPGHEAFTAMRARGAKVTDIAILVVAADDGVMPQTIEAIDHAKAAGVPIIVAVNKIDKAEAQPDQVLNQLMEHGLLPDKFGGDTVTVNVSAKKRLGLDDLLEMILLVSDMQELKANPERPASGVIIEAELSRGKGAVATALVQNGTLREGDLIVAGSKSGRVRALFDDRGERIKAAGPSMPVEVLGLDEVPQAGDRFEAVSDLSKVKALVEQRKLVETTRSFHHVTLESLHDLLERGEMKDLNVIIKADVQGTAEAIADQVRRLTSAEVQVNVVRTASGAITENDVNLAASSNAIVIGFNSELDQNAQKVREATGVDVRTYSIIYQITDDLEKAIRGLIQPLKQEVQIGTAEIRQIYKFGKNLIIAGSYVTNGKIQRGSIVKIEREGQIIYEGKLETLKRFKDDAREVAQGFECGMSFEKFNEIKEGDLVHAYIIQETKREPTRQ